MTIHLCRAGAGLVRRPAPGTCLGGGRAPRPGRSWSARSCCSRPRWRGCCPPTRPGWPGGRRPRSLAAGAPAEAVRQWDRLGYPRRALRLHAIAQRSWPSEHGGRGPGLGRGAARRCRASALHRGGRGQLRLRAAPRGAGHQRAPGAGPAGDAASRCRPPQHLGGRAPAGRGAAAAERRGAPPLVGRGHGARRAGLHRGPARTARRARSRGQCAWRPAGQPGRHRRPAAQPGYAGSDRECRGRLLAVLRAADGPVPAGALDAAWPDPASGRGRWRRWSPTAWPRAGPTVPSACPATTPSWHRPQTTEGSELTLAALRHCPEPGQRA